MTKLNLDLLKVPVDGEDTKIFKDLRLDLKIGSTDKDELYKVGQKLDLQSLCQHLFHNSIQYRTQQFYHADRLDWLAENIFLVHSRWQGLHYNMLHILQH